MALCMVLAALLVSCGTGAAEQVVKIGAIFPLTGASAATGVKLKYAVEVAQEIINNPHPEINMPSRPLPACPT